MDYTQYAINMLPSNYDGLDKIGELEVAKAYALIAIAEQLKELNARLDKISEDLQNVDYTLDTKVVKNISDMADAVGSIAIRHGGR